MLDIFISVTAGFESGFHDHMPGKMPHLRDMISQGPLMYSSVIPILVPDKQI